MGNGGQPPGGPEVVESTLSLSHIQERLARSRKPWCLYNRKEKQKILDNMKPALIYWHKLRYEYDRYLHWRPPTLEEYIKKFLEGEYNLAP